MSGQGRRGRVREIRPSPKQHRWLKCPARISLFGGGAGGGKSTALLLDPLYYRFVDGWAGVLFRREQKAQDKVGSIMDKARALYRSTGAQVRGSPYFDVRWNGGKSRLGFSYLDAKNYEQDEQGPEYAWVGFDEATHFELAEVLHMFGTRMRTTTGVRQQLRMTCNPDPDHWLRGTHDLDERTGAWVDWYLDEGGYPIPERAGVLRWFARAETGARGRVIDGYVWGASASEVRDASAGGAPFSFAFHPSTVLDNAALLEADPGYYERLGIAGDEAKVLTLRDGCWNARARSEGLLSLMRACVTDEEPPRVWRWRVRAWDRAHSTPSPDYPNPDWTVGTDMGEDLRGNLWILDQVRDRQKPPRIDSLMRATATMDGRARPVVIQEDPSAGKVVVSHMVGDDRGRERERYELPLPAHENGVLGGFRVMVVRAANKVQSASGLMRRLEEGRVRIVRAEWTPWLLRQADAFGTPRQEAAKDDAIDSITTGERAGPRCGGVVATPDPDAWKRIAGVDAKRW